MVVMPAFAESHERHEGIVAAVVLGTKRTGSVDVAYGVDAPGGVMGEGDADHAAPQQSLGGA